MIPNMKLTVKHANGTESVVEAKPRSQMALERKFDISISDAFADGRPRFEYLYFMAWHALKSAVSFEEWSDSDDLIGIDLEVDDDADPTPPTPSDGS